MVGKKFLYSKFLCLVVYMKAFLEKRSYRFKQGVQLHNDINNSVTHHIINLSLVISLSINL